MNMNTVSQWATIFTIWAGLLGQSAFLFLYATRPWRKYRITQALMVKSFAFWCLFALSGSRLATRGVRKVDDPLWLILSGLVLDALILFAIYFQTAALFQEIRRSAIDGRDPYTEPERK